MTQLIGVDQLALGALEAWELHLGRRVDARVLREELGRGTLPQAFSDTARRSPRRAALTIDGATDTHGQMDQRAARIGGWLRDCGVELGQRVILSGDNSLDFIVAYLGILRTGAVAVPVGSGLSEPELRHLADDSGASCAVAEGPVLQKLRSISAGGGPLKLLVALRGDGGDDIPKLERALLEGEPRAPVDTRSDDVAMLAYTSGTTGQPKGVPLSHANLLSSLRGAMWAWRWSENDTLVHALPFSHQHGLSGVQMTLLAGSRAVVHAKFDPEEFCSSVESEKPTVVFAVPAIYEKLTGWSGIQSADFSSLRLAVSGSAPMSSALARKTSSLLGIGVLERYGSTETGMSVSNPYDGERRFGSVGLPLPGTELAIAGDEGQALSPGEPGEIVLRGPQVFDGYWENAEATAESFYPGGWFRTGDVGVADPENGYLTITGRSKEMIISGGLNVYPREVEFALEGHAGVEQAAVVGVPSERWGEEVVAFIVEAGDDYVDVEALGTHARERLSSYKVPKRFIKVEDLPRNEMGKVLRDELIEKAGDHEART